MKHNTMHTGTTFFLAYPESNFDHDESIAEIWLPANKLRGLH